MSRFSEVRLGPPIEVFALNKAYAEDTFEQKVSLGVGGKSHLNFCFFIYHSNVLFSYLDFKTILLENVAICCNTMQYKKTNFSIIP